jgi:hypothetical protein
MTLEKKENIEGTAPLDDTLVFLLGVATFSIGMRIFLNTPVDKMRATLKDFIKAIPEAKKLEALRKNKNTA